MKIGVFGGTFDPIHNGHFMIAEEVRIQLNLAEVLFVPAGRPWLKSDIVISAVEHRQQMVRLAIADNPYFPISTLEIDRDGPSYTVDTIAELKSQRGEDEEFFFILGWDSLADLSRWRQPSRLLTLCWLVTIPRPGCPSPDIDALDAAIPRLAQRTIILDKPVVDISATDIRRRVAGGEAVDHLVPAAVAEYIIANKLYLP